MQETMDAYKLDFARFLIRAQALQFGEFTLKSGRISPYFFNSSCFDTGPLIHELGRFYARGILARTPQCSVVFGPAYKGIPLCVATAEALSELSKKPIGYFFNRKEKKPHGDGGTLVGKVPISEEVVVMVDDVITDGQTKVEAIELVRQECRVDIREIWVAVDRLERNTEGRNAAADLQARTGVAVQAIATIRELCDALDGVVVEGRPVISSEQRVRIERYLEEYGVS